MINKSCRDCVYYETELHPIFKDYCWRQIGDNTKVVCLIFKSKPKEVPHD